MTWLTHDLGSVILFQILVGINHRSNSKNIYYLFFAKHCAECFTCYKFLQQPFEEGANNTPCYWWESWDLKKLSNWIKDTQLIHNDLEFKLNLLFAFLTIYTINTSNYRKNILTLYQWCYLIFSWVFHNPKGKFWIGRSRLPFSSTLVFKIKF